MTVKRNLVSMPAVLVALAASTALPAEDWPQWRGTERSGVTSEPSGFPAGWPPKKLWTANVGKGGTSPIVADGWVFAMGWQGKGAGEDAVFCFDARTGKELWRQTYASRFYGRVATGDQNYYGGPNSTPTYDPATKRLYTLGIDGDLRCWDASRGGKPVWAKNLYDEFHVAQRPVAAKEEKLGVRDYGFSSAPLLRKGCVLVDVGAPAGLVVAFDAATGAVRWQSESKEPAGSNSGPALVRTGGVECVASFALRGLVLTRLDAGREGRTLLTVPWETACAVNVATPAVIDGKVVLTSGLNVSRLALFDLFASGAKEAWTSDEFTAVASPVIHGGNLFLSEGSLRCLDLATGRLKWKAGALDAAGGSCIVTGDGKVIASGRKRLALVDAADGKVLSTLDGVPAGWPSIALADGVIVCKDNDGNVAAYSVREAREKP